MTPRSNDEAIDVAFPTLDEIVARADLSGLRLPRDLRVADWNDTTGDARWRSLRDATWRPETPLTQAWR